MPEIYKDVYIENSAITECVKNSGVEGCLELMDKTIESSLKALGGDYHVDSVEITYQTAKSFLDKCGVSLKTEILARLIEKGVIVKRGIEQSRAFSNSQPVVADVSKRVQDEVGRILVIGIEPLNCWDKRDRTNQITRDVLVNDKKNLRSMLEGLHVFARAFALHYGLQLHEIRSIIKKLSLDLHEKKSRNQLAQKQNYVSEDEYDNLEKNRPITDVFSLFDCCPTTNRGAALVISHKERMENDSEAIHIIAHSTKLDIRGMNERLGFFSYPEGEALTEAMEDIFDRPVIRAMGYSRERILQTGILELHNAVSFLVLSGLVEMGLIRSEKLLEDFHNFDFTRVNPSGGLFMGHPLAVTFLTLLHVSRLQLLQKAGEMQIENVDHAVIQSIFGLRDKLSLILLSKK